MLRLPARVISAGGVTGNVLCFDKKPAAETPSTRALWA